MVKSEKNVGSTFIFIIPFKKMTSSTELNDYSVEINTDKPLKNVSVLLAEDQVFNRLLAMEHLEILGCDVTTALNGEEAFQQAQKNNFDVILMDLHMPILDGFEATKKIMEAEITTPILGFTADILPKTRNKVAACGMQGLIPKPFAIKELVSSIQQVISNNDKSPVNRLPM
jgi:CheY-like chemotaxis protein